MDALTENVKTMMGRIKVLIVDDEYYTRKVIRTLLLAMGCTKLHEATDGASGLDAIRALGPDIVLLDWEMPGIDGAAFVRRVRSPGTFPLPHVPIIMLTGHGDRSASSSVRLGLHEFCSIRSRVPRCNPHAVRADQAAQHGQALRLLRPGAAQAGDLQAGSRQLQAGSRDLQAGRRGGRPASPSCWILARLQWTRIRSR